MIADDHPLFRRGLREVIEEDGRYAVVAECTDGSEVLEAVEQRHPRAVVLDMEMPRMGGLEAAALLRRKKRGPAILFLTMHNSEAMYRRAMEIGALGYVLKDTAADEIVQALDSVVDGIAYVGSAVHRLHDADAPSRDESDTLVLHSRLTSAERRVLQCIAENMTTEEIAELLCISPRTVEGHRSNISHKLGLNGSYALVRFALLHRSALTG
ncbi:MAG: response regulator transcription factor [Bacteroidota bacterium]